MAENKKTVAIYGAGVGNTAATFTTAKIESDPMSLNITIKVRSEGKTYDWLDLGCCPTTTNVAYRFNNLYPFTAFRGDNIIISFETFPQNLSSNLLYPVVYIIGENGAVNENSNKIISNGQVIGEIYKVFGVANDYSEQFQKYLLRRYGKNNSSYPFFSFKAEYWLKFYDKDFSDNESAKFKTTGGRVMFPNGWHSQTITFQYRNKTREQALIDNDVILYGKEAGK